MVRHAAARAPHRRSCGVIAYGGIARDPARRPRLLDLRARASSRSASIPARARPRRRRLLVWRAGRRRSARPAARYAAALVLGLAGLDDLRARARVGLLLERRVLLGSAPAPRPPRRGGRRPPSGSACSGSSAGVAFYETFQIAPIVGHGRSLARLEAASGAPARLARRCSSLSLGALPALLWNVRHHWASLHLNPGADFSYASRVRLFLSPGPSRRTSACGSAARWTGSSRRAVGAALYAAAFALFAYGAYRSRRRDVMVVYLTIAAFPFLAAAVSEGERPDRPALHDGARPLPRTRRRRRPPRPSGVPQLILGLALIVSAVGLRGFDRYTASHRNVSGPSAPRSLSPLVAELDRLGIDRVFTNYWLAYRLDFDTNERIVAVENGFEKPPCCGTGTSFRLTTRSPPGPPTRRSCEPARTGSCSSTTSFPEPDPPRDALTPRLHAPLRRRVRRLRAARDGQPTVIRSFGKLVRSSTPSSRTTARSSIRTPPSPGR